MKASGVDVLLTAAFGGLAGIITGKSWPNALRAYRLITTVLLQDLFQEWSQDEPGAERVLGGSQRPPGWKALGGLPDQAHSSSLAITACTERRRLPTPAGLPRGEDAYFFAAGHMNYARYMTWYLRNIENLPTAANNDLVKCAHIYRHTDGGTAVPADQFGEQTYIRRGKCAGVLRGISTNVE